MCCGNNGWGGNGCLWIILLIIILFACGGWGGNGCGCNNSCGCGCDNGCGKDVYKRQGCISGRAGIPGSSFPLPGSPWCI